MNLAGSGLNLFQACFKKRKVEVPLRETLCAAVCPICLFKCKNQGLSVTTYVQRSFKKRIVAYLHLRTIDRHASNEFVL